jgi:hypothetical protein
MGLSAILLAVGLLAAGPTATAAAPSDAEQTAEQEALEAPSGGAGVSPIDIVPRLELRQSYARLEGGVSVHDTTAEIDIQFVHRLLLRYQLPARVMESPGGQVAGLGDVQVDLIAIVATNPRLLVALIGGGVLDTASQAPLGAGKQQVFFGGALAGKPRRWWLAYVVGEEQISVGGDSARPDINQLTVRTGSVLFGRQYNWIKLDLDSQVVFPGGASGRLYGTFEAGSLLVGRVGLFLRTGTQLAGPRQIDYTLAAGIRYLFRLEAGKPR